MLSTSWGYMGWEFRYDANEELWILVLASE